jgi:hypothetical protein
MFLLNRAASCGFQPTTSAGRIVRALAKLCPIAIILAVLMPAGPSFAARVFFLANGGGDDGVCGAAQPCITFVEGFSLALSAPGSWISCLGPVTNEDNARFTQANLVANLDCPGGTAQVSFGAGLELDGANMSVKIRHMSYISDNKPNTSGVSGILIGGSGTLILEDCLFEGFTGTALDIEPNGPLNLVIKNCRFSTSTGGILLKPQAGGSVKATVDHVTVTGNSGGGIKTDSTNGVVNLDVSDSEISNNGGNGINAVAGPAQNIVSIRNSVIARNGVAGVQANGVNAGVLLATTLLDQNTAGALSVAAGGNLFTYGNNSIVGAQGASFTGSATLQ